MGENTFETLGATAPIANLVAAWEGTAGRMAVAAERTAAAEDRRIAVRNMLDSINECCEGFSTGELTWIEAVSRLARRWMGWGWFENELAEAKER